MQSQTPEDIQTAENVQMAENVQTAENNPPTAAKPKFKAWYDRKFNPTPNKKRLYAYLRVHPLWDGPADQVRSGQGGFQWAFVTAEKDNVRDRNGIRYECALVRGEGQQDRWTTRRTLLGDTRRSPDLARVYFRKVLDEDRLDEILRNTPTPHMTNLWDPALVSCGWMSMAWDQLIREGRIIAGRRQKWCELEPTIRVWLGNLIERTLVYAQGTSARYIPLRQRTLHGNPILTANDAIGTEPSPILDVTRPWKIEYADTASIVEYTRRRWFKTFLGISIDIDTLGSN